MTTANKKKLTPAEWAEKVAAYWANREERSVVQPEMIEGLRLGIWEWGQSGLRDLNAGDFEMAACYDADCRDLGEVVELLEQGREREARDTLRSLDTIVRDICPLDLYLLLAHHYELYRDEERGEVYVAADRWDC